MEEEVERKVFYKKDYNNVDELEKAAEDFSKKMRRQYSDCLVTKEYIHVVDILVRVTTVRQLYRTDRILERERIRQRERTMEIGRGSRGRGRSRSR